MEIREATIDDIDGMLRIRRLAGENVLDFELTRDMLARAIGRHCRGFALISNSDEIVGFCIADKVGRLIWGLFVWGPYQGKGYGKLLLRVAVDWLFSQRSGWLRRKIKVINLSTHPDSFAHDFYQRLGWQQVGQDKRGDTLFELKVEDHQKSSQKTEGDPSV